ncbi:MBL fold metallo-hydrolase [Nocardioides insulae]|uniref:MBL fold metallo-hydrolase n=1 Tax=Nocardioides insulae TaxID=394734 RepID=UPI00048EE9A2|nr:MBL fold metallo-hydrolase [Nocardioides insulae]
MRSAGFSEISDRVWLLRHPWCEVNLTVVGGQDGLVVIDTLPSSGAADDLVPLLRRLPGEVVALVNTHWHVDHCFGNHRLREEYAGVPVHAHEQAAEELREHAEEGRTEALGTAPDDAAREDLRRTPVLLPDRLFSSVAVIDLGDRRLELLHPGRGHTAGDLVVTVPEADVLVAGDLVEESGPPAYGPDSFPLEWPLSLDLVLGLLGPDTVVLPGHGAPVGREFVLEQRASLGVVAETIRHLAGEGLDADAALEAAEWPFPAATLRDAVRRGFAHLPRSQKRLPLI